MTPLVSVMIPSYNHDKYISKAIQSVLDQTYTDFELIVCDDCSMDRSREAISAFHDTRICAVFPDEHVGAAGNIKRICRMARGKYLALLNSDDYWAPGKLQLQVDYLESHSDTAAVFTHCRIVDENGDQLSAEETPIADVYIEPNRSQGEWLRYFWDHGNCLCHMSILARRDIYADELVLNAALRQLPDQFMWVQLLMKHPIHILQEPLTFQRWFADQQNTSAGTSSNLSRMVVEEAWILHYMIVNMADEMFLASFGDLFRCRDSHTHEELVCERYFVLNSGIQHRENLSPYAFGYFVQHANDAGFLSAMRSRFHYTVDDFYQVSSACSMGYIDAVCQRYEGASRQLAEKQDELSRVYSSRSWKAARTLARIANRLGIGTKP